MPCARSFAKPTDKEDLRAMARPLPSKTERMVRAILLLLSSAALTLLARALGLYQGQNSTQIAITVLAIVVVAVLISRLAAKPVMRLLGRNS